MIRPLEDIPGYIEQEVRDRIAAGVDGSTLIVDETEEEFLVAYSGFTRTLREKYEEHCEKRGEDAIRVYQLAREGAGYQLSRYESADGKNAEEVWIESV
ncbi:hypothetical protein [Halobacterium bonnevillei]|uniref:Uncharacterized protein n=1 Tax=Halobacterium bonnevillei TaxID=2692200 RepID=A0A6B0SK17_9EURY|nr:hypothetical protein [Halobacterium bonnevillei]MXR19232.1 hypothetical protein [Halobacterium bonnevillei]